MKLNKLFSHVPVSYTHLDVYKRQAGMTAFYMFRLYYVIFWGQSYYELDPENRRKCYHCYEDKDGKFEGAFVEVEDDGHLILHDNMCIRDRSTTGDQTIIAKLK